jgi:F0F1-type ATP synthase assembly protein I
MKAITGFVFMNETPNKEGKPSTWAEGLKIMSEVSYWVVGPIVLALIFGKMLDTHFGTKPWIFLSLTGLAFIISIYGIVKVMRVYLDKINQENNKQK